MYIDRMVVERFRHLRGVELGPFRQPAEIGELIVLAGPNGSGKSSLLELLSLGLATRYNYQYHQVRQMSEHAFGIKLGLSESELAQIEVDLGEGEVVDYAQRNRGYGVHVNLPTVFGPNEQGLNDRVHASASREFTNFTRRLGFFVRSDRSYGARSYRRDQIFSWRNRAQPQHLQSISYSATNTQYEDMYDFLVEQSYHHVYELGLHARRQQRGEATLSPDDPLQPYNDLLSQLFPGYEFQEVTADDFLLSNSGEPRNPRNCASISLRTPMALPPSSSRSRTKGQGRIRNLQKLARNLAQNLHLCYALLAGYSDHRKTAERAKLRWGAGE